MVVYLQRLSGNGMRKYIVRTFVPAAFLLSGACGLVYEILWNRYLTDLLGATALSQLVVLMVFMGGLSLGAMLIGRIVDQRCRGLSCYAALELFIGLYAIFFPDLFATSVSLFNFLTEGMLPGSAGIFFLKVLWAVALIAPPALAMGGTLPAVTFYLTKEQDDLRRNIALLYGLNCLGAVVGVLVGGFVFVYLFGLKGSMFYTGLLNISLGLAALGVGWLNGRIRPVGEAGGLPPRRRLEELTDHQVYRPYAVKRAIFAAGLSGFASMSLQVAWIRYFSIVLGASHSAFTIVVAAFILGIGLGSLLVRLKVFSHYPLPSLLTGLFALTSATIGLGLFFYGRVPFEMARHFEIIAHTPFARPFYEIMRFVICAGLMLLPTLTIGMILPVCVRIASRGVERVGRDVALVYAVNTLGALLGIGITGQLFFRILSLPRIVQLVPAIYVAGTLFLALILRERGRKRILAFTVVLVLSHLVLWRPWSPQDLFVGRLDFSREPWLRYDDFVKRNEMMVVVAERQGPDVQVVTLDQFKNGHSSRSLVINGKPDASDDLLGPDMPTQFLLAHLPMLLHPGAENVFILGAGSGITTSEVLKFPEVKKVTTGELAAEVFEASKDFAASNGRYWENSKHRIVLDDGKGFLQQSKEKFDVIIMEPTNVWQEGTASLFSEDFFRVVKSRLQTGGVVGQWMHLYKVDDRTVNIVLKTFSRVFPRASVFMMASADILLVGYDEQWRFDPENLKRRFYQPEIMASQEIVGNVNPIALLLREVISRGSFGDYTAALTSPVNTINFPVLEEAAEYGYFVNDRVSVLRQHDSRVDPDGKDLLLQDYLCRFPLDQSLVQAVIDSPAVGGEDRLRLSLKLWGLADELGPDAKAGFQEEDLAQINDLQLRVIITHPYYRLPAELLSVDEALNLLGGELMVWGKAASRFWTPEPKRLRELYDRFAVQVDQESAGRVARNAGLSLARGGACGAALTFFRIAEAKGQLAPKILTAAEIANVFSCEVKAGELENGRRWWQIIEQRRLELTEEMQRDKISLDIKLGGSPPSPVYGSLPSRW
jgi:spermidine synthase